MSYLLIVFAQKDPNVAALNRLDIVLLVAALAATISITLAAGSVWLPKLYRWGASKVFSDAADAHRRATPVAPSPMEKQQAPFLVRFKQVAPNGYIGSVPGGEGRILVLEIMSANDKTATDVEVCIEGGESIIFHTTRVCRRAIAKTFLRSDRDVRSLKSGQIEEFTLVSSCEAGAFWGSYLHHPDEPHCREYLPVGTHRIELAVYSAENSKFSKVIHVAYTDGKPELIPLPSGISPGVWNGQRQV